MMSWLLGCGDQKYQEFRRELCMLALPGTGLTNYEANSESITENLP